MAKRKTTSRKKENAPAPPLPSMGKMPHRTDVERIVLGSLLLTPEAIVEVMDMLHPAVFYDGRHAAIYEAMVALFRSNLRIDIPMVSEELKRANRLEEVGGEAYLMELMTPVASTVNLVAHAQILVEKYVLRELIRMAAQTLDNAAEERNDPFELLAATEKELFAIMERMFRTSYLPIKEVLVEFQELLHEALEKKEGLTGVPSGYPAIDRVTAGWQNSDLIIIAARPGMGKTSLMLSMVRNAALAYNEPVAIFSLEMSRQQLVGRFISMEAKVKVPDIRAGKLTPADLNRIQLAIQKYEKAPIYIDDTPGLDPFELRAKARRLKAHHKVKLILVDYLQLMQLQSERRSTFNREQEISTISRTLKSIAKELDIPIIALSQLNREVEKRGGNKRPVLADLRESGAIEQDADLVLFIHRPEKMGVKPEGMSPIEAKGLAEIIFAKNRHGETPVVNLRFVEDYATFSDWAPVPETGGGGNMDIEYRRSSLSADDDIPPAEDDLPPF